MKKKKLPVPVDFLKVAHAAQFAGLQAAGARGQVA